jgi:hypothetical protein
LRQAISGLALACIACGIGGCSSLLSEGATAGAGVAGAAIAHAATHNAGVITAVGLAAQAAADAGLKYAERQVHGSEQDRIAAAAGGLAPGAVGRWEVVHDVPIEDNEHGEVTVSREFGGDGFSCKEIVFSVDHQKASNTQREFYTATVCRDGNVWRWATAEPATERWGTLQ